MEKLKQFRLNLSGGVPNPLEINGQVLEKCSKITVELDMCEMTVRATDEEHGTIEAHCQNWRSENIDICIKENKPSRLV